MQGESELGDREGSCHFDAGVATQHHGFGAATQFGAGGRQAGDGGGGQLGQGRLALGESVVEHGQLGAGLDDASADEVSEHAGAHHLQEVADFVGRKAWQGVEDGLAIGHGRENSIDEDGMYVWIQLQVGVAPLHDHDRPAAAVADAFGAHAAPVEPENRVHEDPADGAERLAVVGQALAKLEWKCDDELSQGRGWQHVFEPIRRGLGHSSAGARGAKSARFAAPRHDHVLAAVLASERREASA